MDLNYEGVEIKLAGDGPNTVIRVMYRDADNYKMHKSTVLGGRITPEQVKIVLDNREGGEFFIPGQVGMTDLQGEFSHGAGWDGNSDHPWHTIQEIEYTNAAAGDLTVDTLVASWPRSPDDWNGVEHEERLVASLPPVPRI